MRTFLYDDHKSLSAKFMDFSGWEMPLQYKGILHEVEAVRKRAGVFDVSHMGLVRVEGLQAELFLDFISANDISSKKNGSAIYTCFCNEEGKTVDDAIVFKESSHRFFVVLNASRKEEDLKHFLVHAKGFKVSVIPEFYNGIIALQGPKLFDVFSGSSDMPKMTFKISDNVLIATTGYTGEMGVEIFGSPEILETLWNQFIEEGAEPCGLGARDILRLEKGYALYGHELSLDISPLESVSAWSVKMDKHFLGKEFLKSERSAYGVVMDNEAIPREKHPVFLEDENIGAVTSGGYSPTLKKPIALILSHKKLKTGQKISIEIRGRKEEGTIAKLPFI